VIMHKLTRSDLGVVTLCMITEGFQLVMSLRSKWYQAQASRTTL
jgi:hypothetical protein